MTTSVDYDQSVADNLFVFMTALKTACPNIDRNLGDWYERLRHELLNDGASEARADRSILETARHLRADTV